MCYSNPWKSHAGNNRKHYCSDLQLHAKIKKTTIDLDTNYTVVTWIQQRDMLIPWIHDLLVYLKYLKLVVGWLASIHWKMTCFGQRKSESIYAAFMPCSSLRNPFIPRNWSILVSMCFMCLFFGMCFWPHFFLPPFQKQPLQKRYSYVFFRMYLPSKLFQARSIQGRNSVDPPNLSRSSR